MKKLMLMPFLAVLASCVQPSFDPSAAPLPLVTSNILHVETCLDTSWEAGELSSLASFTIPASGVWHIDFSAYAGADEMGDPVWIVYAFTRNLDLYYPLNIAAAFNIGGPANFSETPFSMVWQGWLDEGDEIDALVGDLFYPVDETAYGYNRCLTGVLVGAF